MLVGLYQQLLAQGFPWKKRAMSETGFLADLIHTGGKSSVNRQMRDGSPSEVAIDHKAFMSETRVTYIGCPVLTPFQNPTAWGSGGPSIRTPSLFFAPALFLSLIMYFFIYVIHYLFLFFCLCSFFLSYSFSIYVLSFFLLFSLFISFFPFLSFFLSFDIPVLIFCSRGGRGETGLSTWICLSGP